VRANGWILKQNLDDALGGMAIPVGRDAAGLAFPREDLLGGDDDFGGIGTDELICALGDSDGAFGVLAEG